MSTLPQLRTSSQCPPSCLTATTTSPRTCTHCLCRPRPRTATTLSVQPARVRRRLRLLGSSSWCPVPSCTRYCSVPGEEACLASSDKVGPRPKRTGVRGRAIIIIITTTIIITMLLTMYWAWQRSSSHTNRMMCAIGTRSSCLCHRLRNRVCLLDALLVRVNEKWPITLCGKWLLTRSLMDLVYTSNVHFIKTSSFENYGSHCNQCAKAVV